MHELTIAQSIIEIAIEYLDKPDVNQIHEVEIEIGSLSGVVREALEFGLDSLIKGTRLENTKISFCQVTGIATCLSCQKQFETDDLLMICPFCGGLHYKIIDGKQLQIKSMKIT